MHQPPVIVPQMHAAAATKLPRLAVGTLAGMRPLAIAEREKTVLPYVPEVVVIDIALGVVGADARAAGYIAVDTDRGDGDTGGTHVEVVAHLSLVTAQETLAGIAEIDFTLAARAADKLQHADELLLAEQQALIGSGAAGRKDGEYAPITDTAVDKQLLELLQTIDHRGRYACDDVVCKIGVLQDVIHSLHGAGIAMRIAAYVGVRRLESVDADRHRTQPRSHERGKTFARESQAVGDHTPHISATRDLLAGAFQIVAHEHLAAREYDKHLLRGDMRRDLLIEHMQEIVERHILLGNICPAVAAAMAARQITPQRALPKERRQAMTGDGVVVEL